MQFVTTFVLTKCLKSIIHFNLPNIWSRVCQICSVQQLHVVSGYSDEQHGGKKWICVQEILIFVNHLFT